MLQPALSVFDIESPEMRSKRYNDEKYISKAVVWWRNLKYTN
jgi:hypothetical protein